MSKFEVEEVTPKYPKYMTLQSRLATFNLWPQSLSQRPETLSNAGFFYTGRGDRVVCFICGGGLKDWILTANPWTEHALKFPHCSFVFSNKHLREVKVAVMAQQDQDVPTQAVTEEASSMTAHLCQECRERELGVVFLPCGHMVTCDQCGRDLKICPLCQSNVIKVIKAFLP